MRFTVPQFIEHEAKIVGPLTFRQFILVGGAGIICFTLYFSMGKTNFFLFLLISTFAFGIAFALAFLKIGGRGLPTFLGNFLRFKLMPTMYIWRKIEKPITVFRKETKKEAQEEELPLKIAEKSRLKKLHTQIMIKAK